MRYKLEDDLIDVFYDVYAEYDLQYSVLTLMECTGFDKKTEMILIRKGV